MRTIVIGDVHGCLRELQALVDKLNYDPSADRLVFLGDLVDKGPDSPGVVRFVRTLPGVECTEGNHEEKAKRWLKHEAKRALDPKYKNPMKTTKADQFAPWTQLSTEDVEWLASLPISIDLGNGLIAAHAGMIPGVALTDQHRNDIMRVRWIDTTTGKSVSLDQSPDGYRPPAGAVPWMELWDGPNGIVYGHVVHTLSVPRIDIRPGGPSRWCYGIDTGCVHGGRLTALVFPDGTANAPEIVQVEAFDQYAPWFNVGSD